MRRQYLEYAARQTIAACTPGLPEVEWRAVCAHAQMASMIAFLIEAIERIDYADADAVATDLDEMCTEGQPLADWVDQQLGPHRVEELIAEAGKAAG
jgi:hypothetical protein